ncbi:MAG: alkaline phosphatase family protein, partial [Gammaproteobacteria bacterium]|nr:alkaline phosphatase family protein [Gammaproteobacteria bacterium]
PFWSTLSDAGKRVAIIDLPKTYPTKGLNGIQVVDWANHDADTLEGFLTWPTNLRSELDRRYGSDPFNRHAFGSRGPTNFPAFVDGLCKNVEHKTRLFLDLLNQEPWDLLFAAWDDAHWAGHFGWRLHDPTHPFHDPDLVAEVGDPLARVLITLDRSIGEIIDHVGPETTIMLLSSHGMGPAYRTSLMIEPILRRLEATPEGRNKIYKKLRLVWDNLPGQIHRPLTQLKDFIREGLLEKDRARRRSFPLPCNNDGGCIRLNVIGRDPEGLIQPGAEYDAHCQWLIDELSAVVDADTGEPIIRRVVKIRDHMDGEHLNILPDLAIQWNVSTPTHCITSPRIGEIETEIPRWRTGEHLPQGFLLSTAAGVVPGEINSIVRAEDLAPTVGRLLDVPFHDIDGSPVEEMLPRH